MKSQIIPAITLAALSITLGILDPLRPAPKQALPDPVLPFGPADVSIVRHASTLAERLEFLGCNSVLLADGMFLCPTPDLLPSLLTTCESMRSKMYVGSTFDCDDIAREYHSSASKWMVATFGRNCPAGIAVGEAYVRINGPVEGLGDYPPCGHVVNIVWLANNRLIFVEPYTGKFVDVESSIYEGVIEVQHLIF